jgi:hypothetical protein
MKYEFKLFLSASHGENLQLFKHVQSYLRRTQPAASVELVEVFEDITEVQRLKVLATPALIRISPEPQIRVVGDLSDSKRILEVLGMRTQEMAGE